MKQIKPKDLYLSRKICWIKPEFHMHVAVYAGFKYDGDTEEWLSHKALSKLLQKVNEKTIMDNGMCRAVGECLLFSNDQSINKFELRVSEVYKKGLKQDFLPLPFTHEHYRKRRGTFDNKWLKTRWPALPKDHKEDAFQIAPKDQRSEDFFEWGQTFRLEDDGQDTYFKQNFPFKKISLFSLDEKDQFEEIKLNPDVLWLFPDEKTAVLIAHGHKLVKDVEASNLKYLYVADALLDEPLTLDAHQENFKKAIAEKMPSFKPEEMQKKIPKSEDIKVPKLDIKTPKPPEMDPEVKKAITAAEQKLEEVKKQYPAEYEAAMKQKLPAELDGILEEKDPKIIGEKVKAYAEKKLADAQNKLVQEFPERKEEILKSPTDVPIEQAIVLAGISVSDSIKKLKKYGSAEETKNLPDADKAEKDLVDKLQKSFAEDKKREDALKQQKADVIYKDNDFSNQDLSKRDFTGCDLTGANFTNADLTGTLFSQTKVKNTIFKGASLSQAIFENVNVFDSDFSEANLKQASMKIAIFKNINFNQADATNLLAEKTYFRACQFEDTRFSRAKIVDGNFSESTGKNMNFDQAILKKTLFNKADFSNINMNDIQGEKVNFRNSQLHNIICSESQLDNFQFFGTIIEGGTFELSQIKQFGVTESKLSQVNFSSAQLLAMTSNKKVVYQQCNFENTNLTKASLLDSQFAECYFHKTNLDLAYFRRCQLRKLHLNQVTAKKINFFGCDLSGGYIEKTNFLEAKIRSANLDDATFINSNLYGISLYMTTIENTLFEKNLVKENFELTKHVQSKGTPA